MLRVHGVSEKLKEIERNQARGNKDQFDPWKASAPKWEKNPVAANTVQTQFMFLLHFCAPLQMHDMTFIRAQCVCHEQRTLLDTKGETWTEKSKLLQLEPMYFTPSDQIWTGTFNSSTLGTQTETWQNPPNSATLHTWSSGKLKLKNNQPNPTHGVCLCA